ncbi:MAG: MBL fold metallo-hydrolase [Kiritimatiellae bacterium]|nr:MBL fold metallo-hydrolase [Kiritimatiellia bacterium]
MADEPVQIETIVVGPFEVNCHLAWRDDGTALVIDPGDDAELIADRLRSLGKRPAAYLVTHGHTDHICALAVLHAKMPAPLLIHPLDLEWAFKPVNQLPPYYPAPSPFTGEIREARAGDTFKLAGMDFEIIEAPGHSPGSICFYFREDGVLFPGDVLFAGSVGRTDIAGGNARVLSQSLRKLAGLPDTTRVYPGHGPETTIGHEKRTNYFMRG